eukprot:TRINITY_DN7816_c0_g1_i1.p2 TRINITY_DN7816_c0_g1~~TRINITY_DN7816_c0_g1_i1.p2  ORF type:complete len:181 (-),score=35.31 TRINITY_DN7816_c0_g1_i1:171-713(-)
MCIRDRVSTQSTWVQESDPLFIGNLILQFISTPGHTEDSYCISIKQINQQNQQIVAETLFTGDTLQFCSIGRLTDPDCSIYISSLQKIKQQFSNSTLLFPSHTPLNENLIFAKSLFPANQQIKKIYEKCINLIQNKAQAIQFHTLETEKEINPYLRLDDQRIKMLLDEDNEIQLLSLIHI